MKYFYFFILSFLFISCHDNPVAEPDQLLSEDKMIEVLYDAAVLEAANAYNSNMLIENNIQLSTYILEKHNIDSTTYAQNLRFYASDAQNYKKMYDKVIEKIETNKALLDTLLLKEKKEKFKDIKPKSITIMPEAK